MHITQEKKFYVPRDLAIKQAILKIKIKEENSGKELKRNKFMPGIDKYIKFFQMIQ